MVCIREDRNEIFQLISFWLQMDLPIIEQEAEVGQSDSELQPPPVGKSIGHAREHQEPSRKRHLVKDSHSLPVAQPDKLCNFRENACVSASQCHSEPASSDGKTRRPT